MWRARSFYLALLAARVAFSVLPAYIHPDELFSGARGCGPTTYLARGSANMGV
ncbi:hypothetical protein DL89DRAFT_99392 [Linderina pennispora]|uniref:Uncharacterized protein n=1 Tax=Linderina pennispora TaxID=61395 RepID=A0A1Y1VW81_9FUNG|nr:uncharacterized protein DL89DRAFT_99392 [Linderina pennispora]ORX65558.1 hypothetical protein DL89DRAFT_99392 [Linderina pennispora]